jgi:hypothetical protein
MKADRLPTLLLQVRRTLRPGDPGTHKLVERFGAHLVCVRYRYDPDTRIRMTTVELVVDTALAEPRRSRRKPAPAPPATVAVVRLRIGYHETELRALVKAAGGRWMPEQKVWELLEAEARQLGLEHRIVGVPEER